MATLYGTTDAARMLGVTRHTMAYHIREGNLAAVRIGKRSYAIEAEELERFKRERRGPGRPRETVETVSIPSGN